MPWSVIHCVSSDADQLHVNVVAKTPKSVDELAQTKSELEGPLSKAFTNTKLTTDQKASVLDLCARYRPVFALSMSELGRCNPAEATFPLPPDIRLIDRARTEPTLELKLSSINVSMICLNGASSKNVLARGVAHVLLSQRRTEAHVSVLIIVIPSTVTLSARVGPFRI